MRSEETARKLAELSTAATDVLGFISLLRKLYTQEDTLENKRELANCVNVDFSESMHIFRYCFDKVKNAINEETDVPVRCPICGESEKIKLTRFESADTKEPEWWRVVCQKCGAGTNAYSTKKEAKEAWNDWRVWELKKQKTIGEKIRDVFKK